MDRQPTSSLPTSCGSPSTPETRRSQAFPGLEKSTKTALGATAGRPSGGTDARRQLSTHRRHFQSTSGRKTWRDGRQELRLSPDQGEQGGDSRYSAPAQESAAHSPAEKRRVGNGSDLRRQPADPRHSRPWDPSQSRAFATTHQSHDSNLARLLDAIERFGLSKQIRTDNESCFISRLFRSALRILGIEHQRIERCAPWQNGRIERFFGTLKPLIRRYLSTGLSGDMKTSLSDFRRWYNHARPHQHLGGRTPAEIWDGMRRSSRDELVYFSAWEGLLTGFFVPK